MEFSERLSKHVITYLKIEMSNMGVRDHCDIEWTCTFEISFRKMGTEN
jgi:hypothetical protein